MRAFLGYIVRGRAQAVTVAALCAVLSLKLPPLSYVSGAVAGLATLRYGASEGGIVVGGSVLLAAVFTYLVAGSPWPVLIFAATTWIPAWVLCGVLRWSSSQALALTVAAVLGMLVVLGMHLAVPDTAAWWREILHEVVKRAAGGGDLGLGAAQVKRLSTAVEHWAPFMTGLLGAGVVLGFVLTLFLARWWHAVLDNPGGFGREFRAMRLDRRLILTTLGLTVLALTVNAATGGLAADLLGPLVIVLMVQGVAVAHALAWKRRASVWWLMLLYGALLLLPQETVMLLAAVGVTDPWVDARGRWGRA